MSEYKTDDVVRHEEFKTAAAANAAELKVSKNKEEPWLREDGTILKVPESKAEYVSNLRDKRVDSFPLVSKQRPLFGKARCLTFRIPKEQENTIYDLTSFRVVLQVRFKVNQWHPIESPHYVDAGGLNPGDIVFPFRGGTMGATFDVGDQLQTADGTFTTTITVIAGNTLTVNPVFPNVAPYIGGSATNQNINMLMSRPNDVRVRKHLGSAGLFGSIQRMFSQAEVRDTATKKVLQTCPHYNDVVQYIHATKTSADIRFNHLQSEGVFPDYKSWIIAETPTVRIPGVGRVIDEKNNDATQEYSTIHPLGQSDAISFNLLPNLIKQGDKLFLTPVRMDRQVTVGPPDTVAFDNQVVTVEAVQRSGIRLCEKSDLVNFSHVNMIRLPPNIPSVYHRYFADPLLTDEGARFSFQPIGLGMFTTGDHLPAMAVPKGFELEFVLDDYKKFLVDPEVHKARYPGIRHLDYSTTPYEIIGAEVQYQVKTLGRDVTENLRQQYKSEEGFSLFFKQIKVRTFSDRKRQFTGTRTPFQIRITDELRNVSRVSVAQYDDLQQRSLDFDSFATRCFKPSVFYVKQRSMTYPQREYDCSRSNELKTNVSFIQTKAYENTQKATYTCPRISPGDTSTLTHYRVKNSGTLVTGTKGKGYNWKQPFHEMYNVVAPLTTATMERKDRTNEYYYSVRTETARGYSLSGIDTRDKMYMNVWLNCTNLLSDIESNIQLRFLSGDLNYSYSNLEDTGFKTSATDTTDLNEQLERGDVLNLTTDNETVVVKSVPNRSSVQFTTPRKYLGTTAKNSLFTRVIQPMFRIYIEHSQCIMFGHQRDIKSIY